MEIPPGSTRLQETDLSLLQQIQSVIDQYKTREFSISTINERKVSVTADTQVVGSSHCDLVHVHDKEIFDRITQDIFNDTLAKW